MAAAAVLGLKDHHVTSSDVRPAADGWRLAQNDETVQQALGLPGSSRHRHKLLDERPADLLRVPLGHLGFTTAHLSSSLYQLGALPPLLVIQPRLMLAVGCG